MPTSRPRRFSDIARQAETDLDAAWGSDPAASSAAQSEHPSSRSVHEPVGAGEQSAAALETLGGEVADTTAEKARVSTARSTDALEPDPLTLADDPGEWADDDEPAATESAAPEPVPLEPVAPEPVPLEPVAPEPWEPAPQPTVETVHHAPVVAEPSFEAGPASFSDAVTTVMPAIERPDSPAHFEQPQLGVAAALGQRVLVGTARVPLWTLFAAGIGIALLLGGALARLVLGAAPAEFPSAVPPVSASAAVVPSARSPTLARHAALGDPAALRRLESREPEDRSMDESLALARGRDLEQRAALDQLAERVRGKPAVASAPETREKLLEFVDDPRTATEALRVVASLPGSIGPDLLYEVWTGTPQRNDTTRLAEELVYSREVRAKASPSLLVALDLRHAEACDAVATILPRAIQHGDSRSLRMLGKLLRRTGCGPRKSEDCYPCLRGGEQIADAIAAVRSRRAPKFQ